MSWIAKGSHDMNRREAEIRVSDDGVLFLKSGRHLRNKHIIFPRCAKNRIIYSDNSSMIECYVETYDGITFIGPPHVNPDPMQWSRITHCHFVNVSDRDTIDWLDFS